MLLHLAVVLLAAKLAAELCERVNVPAVVGEILAGIVIGPSVLGWVPSDSEPILALAELGVLLLLVQVGMEMDLAELGKVGRASMLVAVIGVVVPFALGGITGLGFGESGDTALFIGAALTATSVGITARVFGDLRALATTEARIVLGAAVADDVLGLIILTVVVKTVTEGSVGIGTVAETVGIATGFLIVAGAVGMLVVPRLFEQTTRRARSSATIIVSAFALTLVFSWAATWAKLAPIIGAFVAGLAIGRSAEHGRVEREFGATANLLIPIFFVQIGLDADLEAMARPGVLGLAGALIVMAVIGKLVSAAGAAGVRADKVLIGIGMIPRGEVGIIFASIGLSEGILGDDQYAALLMMVLATTLVTPPLLRWRIAQTAVAEAPAGDEDAGGEWEIAVLGDHIVLRGTPPAAETVPIALAVARLAPLANPDPALIDWFGRHSGRALTWHQRDTDELLEVMRHGDARSWRFLDVTGVLERALPEVGAALARRRADPGELDPTRILQLPTVERIAANGSRLALLSALVADVCDTGGPNCAAALALRLDPARADEITAVVDGAAILRTATADADALGERRVLQLAEHLSSVSIAEAAVQLAAARLDDADWRSLALQELRARILDVLSHPDLVDDDATPASERRRAAIAALRPGDDLARSRLEAAPTMFLLAHDPVELARQAALVEPLPHRGTVRVAVSPEPEPDLWRIDVACRDRAGLLARLTAVLADTGLDVESASLATWPDGGVLDSFLVRQLERPRPRELAEAIEANLRGRLAPRPLPELSLSFDNEAVPWHTVCTVTCGDHPGVLAAIAAALDSAKVDVHAARLGTVGDVVENQFELTDRHGRKLGPEAIAVVRTAFGNTIFTPVD